jgi:hypothetical protein
VYSCGFITVSEELIVSKLKISTMKKETASSSESLVTITRLHGVIIAKPVI